MTQDTIVPEPLTNKTFFERLLPLLKAVESLELDIKELCEEGKECEINVSLIKSIALAQMRGNLNKLEEKTINTVKLLEELF